MTLTNYTIEESLVSNFISTFIEYKQDGKHVSQIILNKAKRKIDSYNWTGSNIECRKVGNPNSKFSCLKMI